MKFVVSFCTTPRIPQDNSTITENHNQADVATVHQSEKITMAAIAKRTPST